MELLFIRHAETDMKGTFCGHSDPQINAAGFQQMAKLVESLRSTPLDAIYTSDLQRASETGNAIAEASAMPCITRFALREIDFGRWEGLKWEDIERVDQTYAKRWLEEFPHLPAPGGECFETFEARVKGEMAFLQEQRQLNRVAIVTHGGVMRTILRKYCKVREEDSWARTKAYCSSFRLISDAAGFREINK